MSSLEKMPDLYEPWVQSVLGSGIPRETDATCHACPMCAGAEDTTRFRLDVKCCTFLPELPNFLVGRILEDEACEGRESVRRRMAERLNVTPLGLGETRVFSQIYHEASDEIFGQTGRFRCPHLLEEGRCGIWRHREATCATWFCKHVRGAAGKSFWNRLRVLFKAVEKSLSLWCVWELKAGNVELFPLPEHERGWQLHDVEETADPDHEKLWGRWAGREAAFYRECARLVGPLSWAQVVERCGPEVRVHQDLLLQAWERMRVKRLPTAWKLGSFEITHMDADCVQVTTYSSYDALELSRDLFAALPYFEGASTAEARRRVREHLDMEVSAETLRLLYDYEILLPG